MASCDQKMALALPRRAARCRKVSALMTSWRCAAVSALMDRRQCAKIAFGWLSRRRCASSRPSRKAEIAGRFSSTMSARYLSCALMPSRPARRSHRGRLAVEALPVGAGFVDSLAQPGGNATGFIAFEYGLSGKWLELLKQIAPSLTRVAILRDPAVAAGIGQFAAIQSVAPSFGVELRPIDVREIGEIERAITTFARFSNGGLIVTASSGSAIHRDLIITLAARHKLPAVYGDLHFVTGGGLISYGPDRVDQFRRAAAYVDRIFKGEKPADLPVQAPTKYELAINLKTAKALGLTIPPTLLARADEVIE